MSLKQRIPEDLKQAMRSGDERRKIALRMLQAAVHNAEIAQGHELDETGVVTVVRKEVKQRRDAIEQFQKGGREDLAAKEQAELTVLEAYLPEQLSRAEIERMAREVIAEVAARGPHDRGRVMGPLLQRIAGRAEGREVSEVVGALLAG